MISERFYLAHRLPARELSELINALPRLVDLARIGMEALVLNAEMEAFDQEGKTH